MRGRVQQALLQVAFLFSLQAVLLQAVMGQAQRGTVTPVPKLDMDRFLTAWNVQAFLPTKKQKPCVQDVALVYAYGDKRDAFQAGLFCQLPNHSTGEWDAMGRGDKTGGGRLSLKHLLLLHSPYLVFDVSPQYDWALVGTPNHKNVWVLTKADVISPELLGQLEAKASAQGFDLGKLVRVVHKPNVGGAT